MALCQYCGKVEIAWHQVARRWVACEVRRDAAGVVVKAAVRSGTRTIMRPMPDPARPHYPVPAPGAAALGGSYCPSWSAEAAAARPKRRTWGSARGSRPSVPVPPMGAYPGDVPMADSIPVGSIGATVTPAPTPTMPEPEPEPAALVDMDPWERAEALIRCTVLPTRVLLYGPPGTGKTELPWRIAQAESWGHVYQLMTEETPATELLGHLIVQAGSTAWCDGTLGRAIRMSHAGPVVYVIDEVGRASQDALSACLLAVTNPESLRLTLRSGEVIAPKMDTWHVVATSNEDPSMLPPALADRLHLAVNVTTPHPGLVASLTTPEARRLVMAAAREHSIRAIITYDRYRASGMGVVDAARLVWDTVTAQSFVDAARLGGMCEARTEKKGKVAR